MFRKPPKWFVIVFVCLFFISGNLVIERDAEANPAIIAVGAIAAIATILVAAGVTFASKDAIEATVNDFVQQTGTDVTQYVKKAGDWIQISSVLWPVLYQYVTGRLKNPSGATVTYSTSSTSSSGVMSSASIVLDDIFNNSNYSKTWNISTSNVSGSNANYVEIPCQCGISTLGTPRIALVNGIVSICGDNGGILSNWVPLASSDYTVNGVSYAFSVIVNVVASGSSSSYSIVSPTTGNTYLTSAFNLSVGHMQVSLLCSNYNLTSYSSTISNTLTGNVGQNVTVPSSVSDMSGSSVQVQDESTLIGETASAINTELATQTGLLSSIASALDMTQPLNLQPLTIDGTLLTNKFPFSLPWDLQRAVTALNVTPSFPALSLSFPNPLSPDHPIPFTVDVSQFTAVLIPIVRGAFLILFSLGLLFATRKLQGGAS